MVKCVCEECGYSTVKDSVPSKCAYCGEKDAMSEIRKAEDLVDEVE